ncbi:MAG: hypothetical protein ACK4SY_08945 [Pyrobaculum sp.]
MGPRLHSPDTTGRRLCCLGWWFCIAPVVNGGGISPDGERRGGGERGYGAWRNIPHGVMGVLAIGGGKEAGLSSTYTEGGSQQTTSCQKSLEGIGGVVADSHLVATAVEVETA